MPLRHAIFGLLADHEIQAVVDLALNEPPAQLNREMIYCRFPLLDGNENSDPILKLAIECTASLVQQAN